jgi:Peptidase family M23
MSTGNHSGYNDRTLLHAHALHRLAHALTEDLLRTPAEELLIEVDEDHGDPQALVQAFNRVLARGVRRTLFQRIAERSCIFVMPLWRLVAPRPIMASSVAAVLIVMIASGLSMRLYPNNEVQRVASAPVGNDLVINSSADQGNQAMPVEAAPAAHQSAADPVSPSSLPTPMMDAAAVPPPNSPVVAEYSKRVRTITVRPGAAERDVAAASGALTPAPHANVPTQAMQQPVAPLDAPRTASANASVASAEPRPQAAARAPVSAMAPIFLWPVRGPVIAGFGTRVGGEANRGIDVAVPEGTDVHAADGGLVAYAGNLKGYGNLVLVRHGNGLVTAYAHASQLLVGTGDTVRRGQIIAKSGSSGDVAEPQLHFEVRKGTAPVDPMPYLPPG